MSEYKRLKAARDLQPAVNLARDLRDLIKEDMTPAAAFLNRGGFIVSDWAHARAELAGFKATSTAGVNGAVRNWLFQVEKKAKAAGLAPEDGPR
jgi:hypothetical protein